MGTSYCGHFSDQCRNNRSARKWVRDFEKAQVTVPQCGHIRKSSNVGKWARDSEQAQVTAIISVIDIKIIKM